MLRMKRERQMEQTHRILIVEDDPEISGLLKRILAGEGYRVEQAYSGTEACLFLKNQVPDLILLDLMLPGMSGETFLDRLRREFLCPVPVLILSAKSGLKDKVAMLRMGADDYITKPFEPEEVAARVEAALRRAGGISGLKAPEEGYRYKNVRLSPELRKVTVFHHELSLTAREYEILLLLIQNPEKVYSREKLYELVWKDGYYGTDHTVTVHISNLRRKIKEYDPEGDYIQSVYGVGFRLAKS